MPCYLETQITSRFIVRRDIFNKALPAIMKELGITADRVEDDERFTRFELAGAYLTVSHETGQMTYDRLDSWAANAIRRQYSSAVVRQVAQGTRMKQQFGLKTKSEREFILTRRTR